MGLESTKHSPKVDDQLKHEQAIGRSQEMRQPDAPAEGEPRPTTSEGDTMPYATPGPLPPEQVEARAELASFLEQVDFPGDRDTFVRSAVADYAPAHVVERLERLPEGQVFGNVQEIWEATGGDREARA